MKPLAVVAVDLNIGLNVIQNRSAKIQEKTIVSAIYSESNGSAGVRIIAIISFDRGHALGRYHVADLMKRLGIVRCQIPKHACRKATQEHVEIENHLDRKISGTKPNQIWCAHATYICAGDR